MIDEIKFSITSLKQKKNWGKYVISPLAPGFGTTVGNSLRRTLLSSLPGAAVTQMKVSGATHIFSTLKGVKEDLVEIALRIKRIRFSYQGDKPVSLKLEKRGPGEVKAGDLVLQPGVKVANPDLVLANLADRKTTLKMELTLVSGVGYEPAEDHKSPKLGVIALDSVFSPVRKVSYLVEPTRKGGKTDLDRLTIEIWTDGSIRPREALKKAARILADTFNQVVNPRTAAKKKKLKPKNHNLDLLIEEVDDIPLRLANALKKAGYKKIRDLAEAGSERVIKAKNVGKNSIDLLKKVLKKKGVEFK